MWKRSVGTNSGSKRWLVGVSLSSALVLLLAAAAYAAPSATAAPPDAPLKSGHGKVVADQYIVVLKDGSDPGMAVQLTGWSEHVVLADSRAPTAGAQGQDGVMGDVARADLLAGPLDALKEADGDGQAILEEFFGIVWTNHGDGLRNGCSEPWSNFFEQERFCSAIHGRDLSEWLKRKRPQRVVSTGAF